MSFGLLILFAVFSLSDSANILAITPQPVLTHQTAFRPLWKELARRGHNITLLTTNPMNDKSIKNLKEIDASYCYEIRDRYNLTKMALDESVGALTLIDAVVKTAYSCFNAQLSSPEGQNLLHNPDNRFDLLFMEAQFNSMMGFSWKYNIPFIGISSLDCQFSFHEMAGNQLHPISTPNSNLNIEDFKKPTFQERLASTIFHFFLKNFGLDYKSSYTKDGQKYFGEDLPPVSELKKYMAMLFVTVNPLFQTTRAQMPNTINLWQNLEMEKPKPLPKDVKDFVSKAKNGLVYFSLGSNVEGDILNSTVKHNILEAFRDLPYHFIWRNKDTSGEVKNIPKNVLMQSRWLPQQDILRHSNTKLFITHAGINSLFEAAHFGVSALAIPFFGDQFKNAAQVKNLGMGLKLDRKNLTKDSITWAVREILENKKYEERTKEIQQIFNDVDQPPLEKAVWWTEYVLRHKGATHFKNPADLYPWWQYYLLDVIAFIVTLTLVTLFLMIKGVRLLLNGVKYMGLIQKSIKTDKNKKL